MKAKRPPKLLAVGEIPADALTATFPLIAMVNEKGEYLPWDALRHRIPTKINPQIFWSLTTIVRRANGRLLTLNGYDFNQLAFLNITPQMQQTISMVDRLATSGGESELLEPLFSSRHLLEELRAEESISSSQLEGAATTSRVALEMIKVNRAPRDESEKMIMGNFHMMEYVNAHCSEDLSLANFKELHAIAVGEINDQKYRPGEFRRSDDVVVADIQNEIIHHPPTYTEVELRLSLLFQWANKPHERLEGKEYLHPLIKSCILHFMIGFIHPFNDGNGRAARALFYWYMLRCGYSAFRHISISKLLKNASTAYAKSYCYSETDDMDLTYFVDYQCGIVGRALNEYVDYIHHMVRVRAELNAFLYESEIGATLNERQKNLLNVAFARPENIFTVAEVRERLGVSDNTARKDLNLLAELGLLRSHKDGKETVYVSPKSLPQVNQWKNRARPKGSAW